MKLRQVDSYKRTVNVSVPDPDRVDSFLTAKVVVEYRNLTRDQMKEIGSRADKLKDGDDAEARDVVRDILVGVHGIENEDGTPMAPADAVVPFIADNWRARAILDHWAKLLREGGPAAKN